MKKYCPIIFLFLLTLQLHAAVDIIDATSNLSVLSKKVKLLKDEKREFDLDQIVRGDKDALFLFDEFSISNLGFYDGVVWLKFDVKNSSDGQFDGILELRNPTLDNVEVYEIDNKKSTLLGKSGDLLAFEDRAVKHHFHQFPLDLSSGEEKQILIRIDNHGKGLFIPINIWSKQAVAKRDYEGQIAHGVFYGVLIFAFFLNLFIYLLIGGRANLYYLLYIIMLFLSMLSSDGFAFRYLYPNSYYLSNFGMHTIDALAILFLLKLTQCFINTKKLYPKVNLILGGFGAFLMVIVVMSLINNWTVYRYANIFLNYVTLALSVVVLGVAIGAVRKGFIPARFFLIATSVLILSIIYLIFTNLGILPRGIVTNYAIRIGSSMQVIFLSFALVDKFRSVKEEALNRLKELNELKSQQNELLEIQVAERTKKINLQKEELEEKNKEITDSISYAKRIQSAILPSDSELKDNLREGFVFYRPKDIVAGDFYWMEKIEDKVLFAVADCTGHGVPGAMVSVVCFNALNKAVREHKLIDPAKILDKTRDLVIETFSHKSEEQVKDGMDISLCCLDIKNRVLQFSGANNSLYRIKNDELIEVKADKQPIGVYENKQPFTSHTFEVNEGEEIYLFTDGFADQFGGIKGKKLKYRLFREKLLEISGLPMQDQEIKLNSFFDEWKGNLEQIDDVCVMGIRF